LQTTDTFTYGTCLNNKTASLGTVENHGKKWLKKHGTLL